MVCTQVGQKETLNKAFPYQLHLINLAFSAEQRHDNLDKGVIARNVSHQKQQAAAASELKRLDVFARRRHGGAAQRPHLRRHRGIRGPHFLQQAGGLAVSAVQIGPAPHRPTFC